MAKMGDITISTAEYRPCFVNDEKALFHRWITISEIVEPSIMRGGHSGGQLTETFAIVEFENGEIRTVRPCAITFVPSEKFKDYCWE